MFAVFRSGVAPAPAELTRQQKATGTDPKALFDCVNDFRSATEARGSYGSAAISLMLGNEGAMAFQTGNGRIHVSNCDDLFIAFTGILTNAGEMREQFGFPRCNNNITDSMLVLELYRTLRNRGAYSVDHTLRMLRGSFAFVLWDATVSTVFAARDENGRAPMFWGVRDADGAMVFGSQEDDVRKAGTTYMPFPAGSFYCTQGGVQSFIKPQEAVSSDGAPMEAFKCMKTSDSVNDFGLEARIAG